ncbi:DUF6350 family protein [Actinopolymorpha alba]|uniref:cell division protein PerM n=1 Tax=Actinopolymorpha alba TaxID=533267 RepID=UPI0003620503|nr:DUF6350 family protein [Actinopolymorpha alba]
MTELLAPTPVRDPGQPPEGQSPRPAFVGGLLAAGWAFLAGALPCAAVAVIGWFATSGGTAAWALRVGGDAWLLAHRVPIELADGEMGLAPLGLTLLPLILLCRAGAWIGRSCAVTRRVDVPVGAVAFAVAYGGLAALVAVVSRTAEAAPDVSRAFINAGLMAGVAGAAGIIRARGYGATFWGSLPEEVHAAVHGGVTGFVALFAGGILLVGASLVAHAGTLLDLTRGLAPGPVGLVLLLFMCLAYLPNAAVFAAAFALGPGFAAGTGTVVAPTGVALGPLPAFPLLAALPAGEAPPGWVMGVLVMPILAGAVAGVVAVRRYPTYGVDTSALRGGLAGVAAGLIFTGCAAVAGGAAGPGRLADVGPSVLQVGVVAVSTLGIAGAVGVLATRGWRWVLARQRATRARDEDASPESPRA